MDNELSEKIDSAVAKMAEQTKAQVDPNKALHFSQSALNLANAKLALLECKAGEASATSKKAS